MPEPSPLAVVDGLVAGYDIDTMVHEYRINGFVVLENFVAPAGLDEGLLSFSRLCSLLYRKSLLRQKMTATNDSAPSSIQAALERLRARFDWMNENVRRRDDVAMTGDRRDGQGRLTQVNRYKLQIPVGFLAEPSCTWLGHIVEGFQRALLNLLSDF
jgi:hypothetical protein